MNRPQRLGLQVRWSRFARASDAGATAHGRHVDGRWGLGFSGTVLADTAGAALACTNVGLDLHGDLLVELACQLHALSTRTVRANGGDVIRGTPRAFVDVNVRGRDLNPQVQHGDQTVHQVR
jgi:hypothetical protein